MAGLCKRGINRKDEVSESRAYTDEEIVVDVHGFVQYSIALGHGKDPVMVVTCIIYDVRNGRKLVHRQLQGYIQPIRFFIVKYQCR